MTKVDLSRWRMTTRLFGRRMQSTVVVSKIDRQSLLWTLVEGRANKTPVFRWLPSVGWPRYWGLGQVGGI